MSSHILLPLLIITCYGGMFLTSTCSNCILGFHLHSFSTNFIALDTNLKTKIIILCSFLWIPRDPWVNYIFFKGDPFYTRYRKAYEISCIFPISDTDGRSNSFTEKLKKIKIYVHRWISKMNE